MGVTPTSTHSAPRSAVADRLDYLLDDVRRYRLHAGDVNEHDRGRGAAHLGEQSLGDALRLGMIDVAHEREHRGGG